MKLELVIQPTYITDITGCLGSIGHKRGSNNYVIDFKKGCMPVAYKNGTTIDLVNVPTTISNAILEQADLLKWVNLKIN